MVVSQVTRWRGRGFTLAQALWKPQKMRRQPKTRGTQPGCPLFFALGCHRTGRVSPGHVQHHHHQKARHNPQGANVGVLPQMSLWDELLHHHIHHAPAAKASSQAAGAECSPPPTPPKCRRGALQCRKAPRRQSSSRRAAPPAAGAGKWRRLGEVLQAHAQRQGQSPRVQAGSSPCWAARAKEKPRPCPLGSLCSVTARTSRVVRFQEEECPSGWSAPGAGGASQSPGP